VGLIPMPAVDDETGENMVQEYEVMRADGAFQTRRDGIGEWSSPIASRVASLHADAGNGIPVAPGGAFRQPARAIRHINALSHLKALSQERFDARRNRK